jgi:hypothetical protein
MSFFFRVPTIRNAHGFVLAALIFAATAFFITDAGAATKHKEKGPPTVAIGAADHKGLTRLLISWPHPVLYGTEENGTAVTITFDEPGKAVLGATAKAKLRNITAIDIGDDPDHLIVKLTVKTNAHIRSFKTGSNVILDVLDPVEAPPDAAAADNSPESKPVVADTDTVIELTPAQPIALAVFQRGPYLWLATDADLSGILPKVTGPLTASLGEPARYSLNPGTLFRYTLKEAHTVQARAHNGNWDVALMPASVPDGSPAIAVKVDTDLKQIHMLVPGVDKILTFTDPEIGDQLKIMPLPGAGERIAKEHSFPEATILPTAEGIVLALRADNLDISANLGKVVMSKLNIVDTMVASDLPPLYNLAEWDGGVGPRLTAQRQKIMHDGLAAGGPSPRAQAIDLAHLYLAAGYGNEALGYLELADQLDPELEKSADFIALRAAAEALMGRREDALADYANEQLQGQPETALWKGLAEADGTAEQQDDALGAMRANRKILDTYPREVRDRFATTLAALAVFNDDRAGMEEALSLLTSGKDKKAVPTAPELTLRAAIAARDSDPDRAMKLYAEVPRLDDQLWTTLAGYASVEDGLKSKMLTNKQATEKLEGLRFGWRGDALETRILTRLGELYIENGDYKNGLATLQNQIAIDPDSPIAAAARQQIIDSVKQAFEPEKMDAASPLDVLALYDMTTDTLPAGTISDASFERLSSHLAAIGLFDRAADLIQPAMKAATDPVAKAKLGARIAGLRLLDDKPDLALQALAESSGGAANDAKLDDSLRNERALLQARALSKTGKQPEALNALIGMTSREADALRVEITWQMHDWKAAAEALSRLAGAPPADNKLTEEQANIVLNEAVALSLSGDTAGLDTVAKNFGPAMAMAMTDKKDAFALLTSPTGDTHAPNVDAVRATVSGLDIFQNFLASYKKEPGKA